jgi:hypothetical protein
VIVQLCATIGTVLHYSPLFYIFFIKYKISII